MLSTVPVMFSYWAKPEDALDLARYLNDDIAKTVASNPKRFVGSSYSTRISRAASACLPSPSRRLGNAAHAST